ncbi:MAG: site-specific tyrosine recombinase XerD [Pseudomonadota bacterium]|nr:site-specific tyrosine recombinase XerD [SAR86 cluster bacterium]MEC7269455.1 site-specific tyrosine recombinase XerD [Pseudomonadota bacterium]MEC7465568.1 site-specific tyrosine recombinase XerD [Pseudomonadota bacterium]MEC7786903.1 site-specific tyrosine recombinase XerD [Pseudomonadota bacterium]MEC8108373.1 site-specific tyrosine recombinase XerD [Pseudomonadota bacterium]|tara:strand:+ start:353 stop:1249 length:897 start_codon:yes stop_codon:yes gene_type:complete
MNSEERLVIDAFIDTIWIEKGLSTNTLNSYKSDLEKYFNWIELNSLKYKELSRSDVLEYLAYLFGQKLEGKSVARNLSSLKAFHNYLILKDITKSNPCEKIETPKFVKSIPSSLSENEVEKLLDAPDENTFIGIRDKTMIETLYSCGLRISELVDLEIIHVNLRQGVIRVLGKGQKERLVPMGQKLINLIGIYFSKLEENKIKNSSNFLFLSQRGKKITRQAFWHRIKIYATKAGLENNKISPHILRHAFATHLLNNGADLRVVQLLLGHSDLNTTQIYTEVAKRRLQNLHGAHHPRG